MIKWTFVATELAKMRAEKQAQHERYMQKFSNASDLLDRRKTRINILRA